MPACVEPLNPDDLDSIISSVEARIAVEKAREAATDKWQGDIGEHISAQLAELLGFNPVEFEPKDTGFDRVHQDSEGRLVVVEAKMVDVDDNRYQGPELLSKTIRDGEQLSPSWIAARAERMQDPTSSLYSPSNAKIGFEISRDPDSVRAVLVSIDMEGITTAYERMSDRSWNQLGIWDSREEGEV